MGEALRAPAATAGRAHYSPRDAARPLGTADIAPRVLSPVPPRMRRTGCPATPSLVRPPSVNSASDCDFGLISRRRRRGPLRSGSVARLRDRPVAGRVPRPVRPQPRREPPRFRGALATSRAAPSQRQASLRDLFRAPPGRLPSRDSCRPLAEGEVPRGAPPRAGRLPCHGPGPLSLEFANRPVDVEGGPARLREMVPTAFPRGIDDLQAFLLQSFNSWDEVAVARDEDGHVVGAFPCEGKKVGHDSRVHTFLCDSAAGHTRGNLPPPGHRAGSGWVASGRGAPSRRRGSSAAGRETCRASAAGCRPWGWPDCRRRRRESLPAQVRRRFPQSSGHSGPAGAERGAVVSSRTRPWMCARSTGAGSSRSR